MDKRLVERTLEVTRINSGFDSKVLRVALDSSPIWGGGRVEDTFHLIGHALAVVVTCAAVSVGCGKAEVIEQAKLQLVGGSSVKAALDIDWSSEVAQHEALQQLLGEGQRTRQWLQGRVPKPAADDPIAEALATLETVSSQDLELEVRADGTRGIAKGTAKNRRISVEDSDMRHGRKSTSRLFNG